MTPPAGSPPAATQDRPARPERTFSPRTACKEHVARRIGNRAYIKARLELKPEQMTAWSAFEKAADEVSAKENAKCTALPAEQKTPSNFTDRLNMREDMMKSRLESIQSVKPSMLALYAALTPEQKRSSTLGRLSPWHGLIAAAGLRSAIFDIYGARCYRQRKKNVRRTRVRTREV